MSKIQKALEKAKFEQIARDSEIEHEKSKEYHAIEDESLVLSHKDISKMYEPDLLTQDYKANSKIIDIGMSDSKIFNAFRDFRTSIFQKIEKVNPIIMVTACSVGGGSSFVSINLAAVIANDETKTSLLIDCNLAEPGLSHLPITDKETIGIRDYLKDKEYAIQDIIYPTGISRLRVIPAGLLNYAIDEYFTSTRLKALFSEIKNRYDQRYIIVDAPPIAENADARILAQICDYVILVIPHGKVNEDSIVNASKIIGTNKLLGVVFNNVPESTEVFWS